jgi:hypothetical protein
VREPLSSRLVFPLVERRFTYTEYERFLDQLDGRQAVRLREFARNAGDLALRHDVDSRIESALELAKLESRRGFRATYFVLHTAPYWRSPDLLVHLRALQELGHEVGFHNDLVTAYRVFGEQPRMVLERELDRLRSAGIEITGVAAHGSPWCHRLGFHNNYVFAGWDEPQPGFPAREVPEKLDPTEFGLEYEVYHLAYDSYFSDSAFVGGRRAHPADFGLVPGRRTVMLVHPDHWDASLLGKWQRLGRKLLDRARPARPRAAPATASPR